MGNYRFRLSELMPNAWFFKLRDMGKSKRQSKYKAASPPQRLQQHVVTSPSTKTAPSPRLHPSPLPRKAHYYARGPADKTACSSPSNAPYFDTPRKSADRRLRPRRAAGSAAEARSSPNRVSSTVSSGCSCRAKVWAGKPDSPPLDFSTTSGESSVTGSFSPELRSDHVLVPDESLDNNSGSWPSPCSCSSKATALKLTDTAVSDKSPEPELRPIITKPATTKKPNKDPIKRKMTSSDEQGRAYSSLNVRKPHANSPAGVRLRLSSPRISARRSVSGGRRSVSRRSVTEGTAVVKASVDPQKDFKESMVEMIMENNIKASKDLEELLACYLSLNSDEYHDTIIKVFRQIWVDLNVNPAQLK